MGITMTFDEFYDKLESIEHDYEKVFKKKLESLDDLKKYLELRLVRKRTKGLRSLKGLGY